MLNHEQIAHICHEANRAYCQEIGDDSQPAWEDAPQWQKDSAIDGVEKIFAAAFGDDNLAGPESSHNNWMLHKLKEGWRYGEVKDPEQKTHPCLVPYEFLPREQQLKDSVFSSVVYLFVQEKAIELQKQTKLRAQQDPLCAPVNQNPGRFA